MALYRIKPGFDPVTAPHPGWPFGGGMDYLLTSVFEVLEGRTWHNCVVTVDHHGNYWYLQPDWIEPANNETGQTE